MYPNRHSIQLLFHYFIHRGCSLRLSDAHLKFMSCANYSALICPQTSSEAEIADVTLTWLDLFLPPPH